MDNGRLVIGTALLQACVSTHSTTLSLSGGSQPGLAHCAFQSRTPMDAELDHHHHVVNMILPFDSRALERYSVFVEGRFIFMFAPRNG